MTCLLIHSVCYRRLNQPAARDLNIWKITWEKLLIPSAWLPAARPPVPLTPGLPLASAASAFSGACLKICTPNGGSALGIICRLTRRRPRGARRWSRRRADKRRCGRPASRPAPRRRGARCQSPRTGRIIRPGSSSPQLIRIVHRKRRPTSKVDSVIALRARCGSSASK